MDVKVPNLQEAAALLSLLEDDDAIVRDALEQRLRETTGDMSHQIAALGVDLSPGDRRLLAQFLRPGRRGILVDEWSVPSSGLWEPSDDWECFEHLLGLISDFLHDGIVLRPTLMDQLDLLAAEMEQEGVSTVNELRNALFGSGRFVGNGSDYYDAQNSDLCWVISEGRGNPISLALVFMLVGHRLGLEVDGCNFPGHFVARIGLDGEDYLVDCFNGGELLQVKEVLKRQGALTPNIGQILEHPASFAQILRRVLHNLCFTFSKRQRKEDAMLLNRLAASLAPGLDGAEDEFKEIEP